MRRKAHHVALAASSQTNGSLRSTMHGSLGYLIWTICYLSVLFGLSAYGIHRYIIIYLFLKNRNRGSKPLGHFDQLPKVTMQLPIFNEVYVVERLRAWLAGQNVAFDVRHRDLPVRPQPRQ